MCVWDCLWVLGDLVEKHWGESCWREGQGQEDQEGQGHGGQGQGRASWQPRLRFVSREAAALQWCGGAREGSAAARVAWWWAVWSPRCCSRAQAGGPLNQTQGDLLSEEAGMEGTVA